MSSSTSNSNPPASPFNRTGAGPRHARYLVTVSILVVVVIVAFTIASEWLVRTHVAPNMNIEAHAAFLRNATKSGAAFGDSHVAMGIVGSTDIANLGYPANSLSQVIGKAELYFSRNQPRNVILQADPQQFLPGRLNINFEEERALFSGKPFLSDQFKLSIPVYRKYILGHWQTFLEGRPFTKLRTFNSSDGSQTADTSISDWTTEEIREFSNRILYDSASVSLDTNHPVVLEYEALAQSLVDNGASVCFVAYPVDRTFFDIAQNNPLEGQVDTYMRTLAARLGARYVNHRPKRYPRDWFFDPDHLNKTGALEFTKQIEEDCFQ